MSLNPGQSLHPDGTHEETRTAAEALDEGDAVALDSNGELVAADDTDNPTVYGVVGDDHITDGYETGDKATVIFDGPVVANVASGVGAGVAVGSSATDGQLAVGDSAKGIVTKFAEGEGPNDGRTAPDGFAHVDV
jgi:hypothetical protein